MPEAAQTQEAETIITERGPQIPKILIFAFGLALVLVIGGFSFLFFRDKLALVPIPSEDISQKERPLAISDLEEEVVYGWSIQAHPGSFVYMPFDGTVILNENAGNFYKLGIRSLDEKTIVELWFIPRGVYQPKSETPIKAGELLAEIGAGQLPDYEGKNLLIKVVDRSTSDRLTPQAFRITEILNQMILD